MNIKRFIAPDMRQAIRRVREEHGPDAVILKSETRADGVEVVSATGFDEAIIEAAATRHAPQPQPHPRPQGPSLAQQGQGQQGQPAAQPRPAPLTQSQSQPQSRAPTPAQARSQAQAQAQLRNAARAQPRQAPFSTAAATRPQPSRAAPAAPGTDTLSRDGLRSLLRGGEADSAVPVSAPAADSTAARDPTVLAMTRELRALKGLLESELASLAQANLEQHQPVRAEVVRKLGQLGVDPALARKVTEGLAASRDSAVAWRQALGTLASWIPEVEYPLLQRGGRFAFYGPAGVGKTTTISHLVAQFAALHGRQHVGLIGADAQRPGAQREMLALGQQLGVYTLVSSSPAETREALDLLADRRLVLIDTVGLGPRDPQLSAQRALLSSLPGVEPWLVLSATTQKAALSDMLRRMASLKPRACVLTRLDECVTLGEALSAVVGGGLPVAFATCGRQRAEDVVTASPDWLVRRMVSIYRERRREQSVQARGAGREAFAEVLDG